MSGRSSPISDDGEFGLSEDLVASPTHKAPVTSSLDFDGLLTSPLVLHEDLAAGNGGQAWPAGMILARYLLRQRRHEMQRAAEMLALALGCFSDNPITTDAATAGTADTNTNAAVTDRPRFHLTDQESMQSLMQRNVTLNKLESHVSARVYNWGEPCPVEIPAHPAVILAADCVYFEPAFPLLQQTLLDLIGPDSTCYFCFKKRRRADLQFWRAIRKVLLVEEVRDDPHREEYSRENIFL